MTDPAPADLPSSGHATPGHATPAPDACSVGFDRADVSAYGTAARAGFFVALEQPGPWGRDAATQSHLDTELGAHLSSACSGRGGRLTLLRRPGRHADEHHPTGHAVYLAWSGPDPWLLGGTVDDPAGVLDVDLDALARGDREAVLASFPTAQPSAPLVLVCTNGRRDVCCAVRGRPVAVEAAAARPGRVWEASHTGGHRFAPTGVLLPHGQTLARLDTALAVAAVDAADTDRLPAGLLGPAHDRGRSALDPDAQAAEAHVRAVTGETGLSTLSTTSDASGPGRYAVRHRDGRSWRLRVERTEVGVLPESCGKSAVTVTVRTPQVLGHARDVGVDAGPGAPGSSGSSADPGPGNRT